MQLEKTKQEHDSVIECMKKTHHQVVHDCEDRAKKCKDVGLVDSHIQ